MPAYLQMLRHLRSSGREYVSGTVLADVHYLEPVIVRKDLANTGVIGRPRLGFAIDELIVAIEHFLGWDRQTQAVLIGCGNLGTALLGYRKFDELGLRIVGVFDRDPRKTGRMIHHHEVLAMDKLGGFVSRKKIVLGMLAVPAESAQAAAALMVESGIRGIWNFASVKLHVPDDVVVQKEDLAEGLAVLAHRIRQAKSVSSSKPLPLQEVRRRSGPFHGKPGQRPVCRAKQTHAE